MASARDISLHRHLAPHRELLRRYKHAAAQQQFRTSIILSLILFALSITVVFYAIGYATGHASNSVTDIILSNTPVLDVDGLFVYSSLLLAAFIALLLFAHPKRIPFTLHAMALLYFLRAAFISMTHIGPFPLQSGDNFNLGIITNRFLFGGDLFFSGHVALAFLLALVFWREKTIRSIFLAWSALMSVIVLVGHYHYTIDVASAFFITYTIYCMAQWLFPKDRELFYSEMLVE